MSDPETNPVGAVKEIVDQLKRSNPPFDWPTEGLDKPETHSLASDPAHLDQGPFQSSFRLPYGAKADGKPFRTKSEAESDAAIIALKLYDAMADEGDNVPIICAVRTVLLPYRRLPISARLASRVVNILIDVETAPSASRELTLALDAVQPALSASIRIHAFVSNMHPRETDLVALAASKSALRTRVIKAPMTPRASICALAGTMAATENTIVIIVSRDLVLQTLAHIPADAVGITGNELVTVGCRHAAGVRAWLADPQL
jgi:hypothetical protein